MQSQTMLHANSVAISRMPSEEDRTTATGNMYRKLDEIWTVVFNYAS